MIYPAKYGGASPATALGTTTTTTTTAPVARQRMSERRLKHRNKMITSMAMETTQKTPMNTSMTIET